jgi:hypothetical protein
VNLHLPNASPRHDAHPPERWTPFTDADRPDDSIRQRLRSSGRTSPHPAISRNKHNSSEYLKERPLSTSGKSHAAYAPQLWRYRSPAS